ncbi:MAG: hypothetical protein PHR28_06070 [candidate division Zixibacteria bacterium]|nr:hypothetical protein [candidate division Zixibacteria bacterium]
MKKTALFSTLFLAVFGLTLGITFMTYEPAAAIDECEYQCLYNDYCSYDTYSECYAPRPYVVYRTSTCAGGPLDCPFLRSEPVGCWNGTPPCIWRPFPVFIP